MQVFCMHICVCTMFVFDTLGSWKRESDPLELEFWMVANPQVLRIKPGPLQKQQSLLTSESLLQPKKILFVCAHGSIEVVNSKFYFHS